jgi:hypothetical protein
MGCAASSSSKPGAALSPGLDHAQQPHLSEAQPFEQSCFEAVKQVIERHRLKSIGDSAPEDERSDLLRTLLNNSKETNGRIPHGLRAYSYQILSGGAELAVNYAGLYRTLLRSKFPEIFELLFVLSGSHFCKNPFYVFAFFYFGMQWDHF